MVKSTGFSSGGPSSVPSTQSHGSSQPSVMASDALLCHVGIHANRVLIYISKSEEEKKCIFFYFIYF